ncbi:MAG: hypothetical protein O3B03_05415, partial [Proteobacteria bacterium]|nr:hypothetical protein [Pseudomonadota bacterium]
MNNTKVLPLDCITLQDICDGICNETDPKKVGKNIQYKFATFIEGNPSFSKTYHERVNYYLNL